MPFERLRAVMVNAQQGHALLYTIWQECKPWLTAGHRLHIEVRADTRSLAQNRLLWQRLTDISEQVPWHGVKLSPADWKIMLTASRKQQRAVPSIDGTGFVVLGEQTSQMSVAEMTELLDLIDAFAAERGVRLTELAYLDERDES